jgi:hypothetical protein
MSRTPARFTQAEIARAIRAIQQTGADMEILIEPDGAIRITPRAERDEAPVEYAGKIKLW